MPPAEPGNPHDPAATLISAWIDALRESPPTSSPDCLTFAQLRELILGVAPEDQVRAALLRLTACGHCRSYHSALRSYFGYNSARTLSLPALRAALADDAPRAALALSETRHWVERFRITPDATPTTDPPPASSVATFLEPARVDARGRLSLRVAAPSGGSDDRLAIALADGEQRLDLCAVPAREREFRALVDLSLLGCPPGALAASGFHFTLIPAAAAEHAARPRLLGPLRHMAETIRGTVPFWDQLSILVSGAGAGWVEVLFDEINGSIQPHLRHLEAAQRRVNRYLALWRDSNGETPPLGGEILHGLARVLEGERATIPRSRPGGSKEVVRQEGTR